jgi:hypothetical protein
LGWLQGGEERRLAGEDPTEEEKQRARELAKGAAPPESSVQVGDWYAFASICLAQLHNYRREGAVVTNHGVEGLGLQQCVFRSLLASPLGPAPDAGRTALDMCPSR